MPSEIDKAYIKKHKINDMLNELFTEFNSNKPENPIEFAIKHFEAKLPPKAAASSSRPSSVLASKILPLDQQQQQQQTSIDNKIISSPPLGLLANNDNLLAKLMSRANQGSTRDDSSKGPSLENIFNKLPIMTLNIIVSRSLFLNLFKRKFFSSFFLLEFDYDIIKK